jgi:serine protease Do
LITTMKASFLIPALALVLTPAAGLAAELDPSNPEAKQEAAARAQAEAARAQAAASRVQAETAARTAADAAAKARREVEGASLAEAKARIDEAKAMRESDLLRIATGVRIPVEPVTFLGVMTAPAPSSLTTQLGRPAGMGLVVVSVQAKSPAEEVLKVDDLLVRLDDQKLINNDQLTALIRSRQEGEEVSVTYVRGGKEATAKVKLVKSEVAAGKPVVTAITKLSGRSNEEMKFGPSEWKIGSSIQGKTTVENGGLSQTFTYTNGGAGITEIKTVNGKKTVTLRNSSGGIEFTGPYDTEEDRKAVPPAIQTRVADAEARINEVLKIKTLPAKGAVPAAPAAPKETR